MRQFELHPLQPLHQPSHVLVEVGNHAVKVGVGNGGIVGIQISVRIRYVIRPMGRVGGYVAEKRLVAIRFYVFRGFGKPHVGAVAFVGFRLAIVLVGIVKIIVVPRVRRLPDPAPAVNQYLLKTPFLRARRIIVAEVPLPENTRPVAVFCSISAIVEPDPSDRSFRSSDRPAMVCQTPTRLWY